MARRGRKRFKMTICDGAGGKKAYLNLELLASTALSYQGEKRHTRRNHSEDESDSPGQQLSVPVSFTFKLPLRKVGR